MKHLQINTALQIGKPSSAVFEAIVNPEKMKNYFISESSGRMEEGKIIHWRFPEFDEDAPVKVGKIVKDASIQYFWDVGGVELEVNICLFPANQGESTLVRILEKEMPNNEAGIKWLKGNTEGWANFLACLKAYLEFGINLRKGGFDFMKATSGEPA
jgi:uncharacterized protein YndB with AHSA1/START domain